MEKELGIIFPLSFSNVKKDSWSVLFAKQTVRSDKFFLFLDESISIDFFFFSTKTLFAIKKFKQRVHRDWRVRRLFHFQDPLDVHEPIPTVSKAIGRATHPIVPRDRDSSQVSSGSSTIVSSSTPTTIHGHPCTHTENR